MQTKIIDNKQNGLLGDEVKSILNNDSHISLLSSYLSIFAFEKLKPDIKKIKQLQYLLTSNYLLQDNTQDEALNFFGDSSEVVERNKLKLKRLSLELAQWIYKNVKVRALNKKNIVGTNLLLVQDDKSNLAITLSTKNINLPALGYSPSEMLYMHTLIEDKAATAELLQQFLSLWNNTAFVDDIKPELLDFLKKGYKDYSPRFLYFFTLYNLFKDLLFELDESKIVKSKTGFKDTSIWNTLYNFQKDGVLGAIDKIEKYNGCIIADSVGLGKTYEGLAIIKYYELRNDRVLVLCPKKLRENWTVYTLNDKRNIFLNDRFNFNVINHTDLSRDTGYTGEINLETINWGNYDLVVIDESHNFRNNNPRRGVQTRYQKLMNSIIRAGVKTKVLMISATPVNNRMNDLKNQVAFITEGDDSAFEDYGIYSIHELMKRSQQQFNQWLRESIGKNVNNLVDTLDARYFKLLDLITIARSRKHIEKYYKINDFGDFPLRLQPINIKSDIDTNNEFPSLREINKEIRKLNLSPYSPLKYVRADKKREYSDTYDMRLKSGSIFKQIDREQSLIHLMRVNMLKRMESSINSFKITIQNLLVQIDAFLEKIQNRSEYYDDHLNIESIDIEDPEIEDYLIGNKIKVLLQDMDAVRWKQDLLEDKKRLTNLLESSEDVSEQRDAKLQDLKEIIFRKVKNPFNGDNKKILIFTAFADTAQYLYKAIAPWALKKLKIHTAIVTGKGDNKCNLRGIKSEFNEILTFFSPKSKLRDSIYPDRREEIDILIATDCISEGQNLQDCDYLVNYDIHWNPVRIIQRFGRIDRLGSENQVIQLVNFWPNMELDEYINLEARVSGRMVLLDISATGEENIIDAKKEMNDLEYRKKQLEQLQNTVIDLEEMEGGISITDLTYNDFKMDLMEYLKENENILRLTPSSIHSVVKSDIKEIKPGVIFCLKHLNSNNNSKYNPLEPYYLIYVSTDAEVVYNISQSKKVIDIYQGLCSEHSEVLLNLEDDISKKTKHYKDMSFFTDLLEVAIRYIVGTAQEKGISSLFTAGGTVTVEENIKSLEDFELLSMLIITD